jgi:hypothetical protein
MRAVMKKLIPPRRQIRKNGIPLDDEGNKQFVGFLRTKGFEHTITEFLTKTGLYLRGRCSGRAKKVTDPCGYVFISRDSFEKGHRAMAFFDPAPNGTPLKLSFRRWNGHLPFNAKEWKSLDGEDRLQKGMRVIELTSDQKLVRAIVLAEKARDTFADVFDLSADRLKAVKRENTRK